MFKEAIASQSAQSVSVLKDANEQTRSKIKRLLGELCDIADIENTP